MPLLVSQLEDATSEIELLRASAQQKPNLSFGGLNSADSELQSRIEELEEELAESETSLAEQRAEAEGLEGSLRSKLEAQAELISAMRATEDSFREEFEQLHKHIASERLTLKSPD